MSENQAACPVCDTKIAPPETTMASEIIPCPDCGSDLEVSSVMPFSLVEAPHEEEDWGQ